jgi:hypothetical protein
MITFHQIFSDIPEWSEMQDFYFQQWTIRNGSLKYLTLSGKKGDEYFLVACWRPISLIPADAEYE